MCQLCCLLNHPGIPSGNSELLRSAELFQNTHISFCTYAINLFPTDSTIKLSVFFHHQGHPSLWLRQETSDLYTQQTILDNHNVLVRRLLLSARGSRTNPCSYSSTVVKLRFYFERHATNDEPFTINVTNRVCSINHPLCTISKHAYHRRRTIHTRPLPSVLVK